LVHFREELDELQRRLLEMAGLVESAIHQSVSALVERDDQLAKEVLWKEAQINQKDIEIDEFATRLLALYQPMARDMRFLTAAIKINGDLERMGDLAVNITERALSLMKEPPVKPLIDIPRMADLAEAMVRKSLDALVKRDEQLARSVLLSDDEVDQLRDAV
jgi:phosphate transport system protein